MACYMNNLIKIFKIELIKKSYSYKFTKNNSETFHILLGFTFKPYGKNRAL